MALLFLTSANSIVTSTLPGPFSSASGSVTVGVGDGPSEINTIHINSSGSFVGLNNISIASSNGLTLGFGVVLPTISSTLTLAQVDPSVANGQVQVTSTGSVVFTSAISGNSIASPNKAFVFNQRNYIELFLTVIDGNPSLTQLRVNGEIVAAGLVGLHGITNPLTSVRIGVTGTSPPIAVFDSIYAGDTTGSVNNTPLGDINVGIMQPIGDGQFSQWQPTGKPTDWEAVDNVPTLGDAFYISASTNGNQCAVAVDGALDQPNIFGVSVVVSARGETSSAAPIEAGVGNGATIGYGSTHAVTTSYQTFTTVFNQNPNTSATWQFDDLTSLQAAVEYT